MVLMTVCDVLIRHDDTYIVELVLNNADTGY